MNKIYKVIWSKAKHTYVVASEIAKGHTKGETTGKGLKKLAAAMLVAAALLSPSFAWAADTDKATVTDTTSGTTVEVYTQKGAENKFATVDQLQADVAATNAEVAKKANQVDLDETNTNLAKKANQADLDETNTNLAKKANQVDLDATNANLAKKANQTDLDATNENLAKKADKATTLEGYGITDAYTKTETDSKFATADQLQADVAATNEELAKKADKATTLKGYGITNAYTKDEADGKFATVDQLQADVAATNEELAKKADKAKTLEGYGITDAYTKTEVDNKVDAEKTARESADSALGSRTSALEAKTGALNRVAAANSTSINESMTLKDKQYSATLQVNGSGAQIGVVNNSDAGLANDGGTAYTEYRARTGAILSKATNDISSTSSNGQVVDTAGDTTGEYSQVATVKSTGTTFTYDDGTTSSSTTIKGDSVSTGTVSATAGITDGTTTDGTSVKASQTVGQNLNALDERITNVKEYVLSETVSKTDAAVQDGAIVKAANTIGDNVTKLDAALAKETAARIGADKAQDKVIQQVNDNAAAGIAAVNTALATQVGILNQADANEAAARAAADAAETAGRVAADTELVKATNGGLALNDKNVLQKNETTIENGTVTTKTTAADTLIMNEGATNQITLSKNGIKVGTNSTVIASDGVFAGGDTAEKAKAALNADGSIKGADGAFTVDKSGNVTSNGTVTGKTLTDGIATLQNGNLNTTGNVNAHDIVATGDISGKAITGTSLNTQGGAINGGAITGTSINGTTGTFGSLTTTSNASVGGTLTANGITNTGNATTDTLTVNHNATVGGNLGVTGDITGKSLNVGTGDIKGGQITGTGLDVGAGTIKTTGAVETGTLTTTGDATIGGDLTVKGKLNVDEIKLTKTGIDGDYHVTSSTKVAAGEITSYKKATSTKDGSEKESAFDYDENGTSTWAQSTDADRNWNKSTLTVKGNDVTSKVVDSKGNINESTQTASESGSTISSLADEKQKSYITQNLKKILQGIQNGTNATTVDQTETGIKSTATDGKNTASTNLSNKGFNTYATDGTNKTYTLQTAESLTSQIGDDGKVKSAMNADGITNNADGGTITNSAKDLVNTATGDITNTAKNGTITNDAKELVNTATGNMTNTVGGKLLNDVTGDMEDKVGGKLTTTVTGDVTEDYKANLSTTVGGNQTTTVTGDSSLTAENINNEAKNKITNKALDVETDAKSSIVNKVSNEYGSNTSNQLSYETKEEMSADGKTASYLRGAAEEKSQLTDGEKKTTIDTIAGQTNTNITEGKNISNSLQKADQAASSVTDGTNTTVVNQDAKSLASSITDGTKANNTSSTVDKSEQLIKKDDTHYYAETKTADSAVEALKSDGNTIIIGKDAAAATVSSAVTDGATITGISQNAKDINLSAAGGTIANSAKNITNTAAEKLSNSAAEIENTAIKSITDKVGENTSWKMTDGTVVESVKDKSGKANQTTTTAADTYQFVKDGDNTLAKRTSSTNDNLNITDGTNTYTKITTATGNKQTVTDGAETASTNLTKSASNTLIENGTQSVLDHMAADTSYTVMNENGNGSRRQQTASEILDRVTDGTDTSEVKQTASEVATSAKDISNTATEKITSQIGDGSAVKSEMTADSITNITGNNTVTSNTKGTTFENKANSTAIKEGTVTKTTISGNTMETGLATMDYADVMKDLGVRGNATIKGDTTMEGNASVGKNLTVAGTSKLTGDVTMENNASVGKNLTVKGDTEMVGNATVKKNLTVEGETNLKNTKVDGTLNVTGSSEFDGKATFNDIVTMNKGLSVTGGVTADTVTAKSFKVGENTYIDENGINANNRVIKNVGQGDISEGSTDAVSGGQLYETNTRVSGLETRMGTVETKVDKLDNKIDKVGANAAAMANLHPLEFDEDSKWNIAAAVGSSGSETASAVGVFYRPNENVMVNASAAMGTGENMFGGGVSLRLGHGGNKAKEAQMKAAAKENRELRAKVDDLTARMDALLSVLNPNMSKDFPDVPENHWAYEAVSRLAGNGIVEGYEDGKYHGERQMTRYEMAEIIYNALSKGAKAEKKLVEEFRPELQAMAAQKKA